MAMTGENVKSIRSLLEFDQARFSDLFYVNQQTVSNWEARRDKQIPKAAERKVRAFLNSLCRIDQSSSDIVRELRKAVARAPKGIQTFLGEKAVAKASLDASGVKLVLLPGQRESKKEKRVGRSESVDDQAPRPLSPIGEAVQNFSAQLQQAASQGRTGIGISTGFKNLDRKLNGWQKGQLIIVGARPGIGKSSFLLNAALHAANRSISVAFFSMEMTKEELSMRLLAMESRVEVNRIRSAATLTGEHWKRLQQAATRTADAPVYLDDSPNLDSSEIERRSQRIECQNGVGLIIVDYLQLMRGSEGRGSNYTREQEIADIIRGLKAMAKRLQVPVIAACQLSRSVEQRENKKPILADLPDFEAMEQDADVVIFIHRNKADLERQHEAEIVVEKNRSGPTGSVRLIWDAPFATFTEGEIAKEPPLD